LEYLDPSRVTRDGFSQAKHVVIGSSAAHAAVPAGNLPAGSLAALEGSNPKGAPGSSARRNPPGGCIEESDREVKAGAGVLTIVAPMLAAQAEFSARHDRRMLPVLSSWQMCMSRSGLHYADPAFVPLDPRWSDRSAGAPASSVERRTASVDATCQQAVNYVGLLAAVDAAYQEQLIAQNKSSLVSSFAVIRQWARTSRAIIARG
jgi:hypothetical protein